MFLGVELDVFLLRMFSTALGRDRRHRSLQDLEERPVDPLSRDVPRDRRVLGLPRDLVHLVDVDDSAFTLGHVEIGGLEQPNQEYSQRLRRRIPLR